MLNQNRNHKNKVLIYVGLHQAAPSHARPVFYPMQFLEDYHECLFVFALETLSSLEALRAPIQFEYSTCYIRQFKYPVTEQYSGHFTTASIL